MLYTPILVDRLQLEYPSGHAVANILRALTDPRLLRRSIGRLGGGTGAGLLVAALVVARRRRSSDVGVVGVDGRRRPDRRVAHRRAGGGDGRHRLR